jgi:16S rRNA (guanine527-N7)-methyltransferase
MLEFLRTQIRPNLQVVLARAEEWRAETPFDVVTGRALAPIAIQLELSAIHTAVGGRIIPMRTAKDRAEIESFPASLLRLELVDIVERELPGADAMRVFPVYLKRAPTPRAYPRRWADMRSRPLGT